MIVDCTFVTLVAIIIIFIAHGSITDFLCFSLSLSFAFQHQQSIRTSHFHHPLSFFFDNPFQ